MICYLVLLLTKVKKCVPFPFNVGLVDGNCGYAAVGICSIVVSIMVGKTPQGGHIEPVSLFCSHSGGNEHMFQ